MSDRNHTGWHMIDLFSSKSTNNSWFDLILGQWLAKARG